MVAFLSQFLRAGALGSIKTSYAQPKKTDHLKVVGFLSFGRGIGCRTSAAYAAKRGVTEEKTMDHRFFKDVTETKRNEANLRFAHISTMFQEVFDRSPQSDARL